MTDREICPGCGRHCNLNEPHCERGREYIKTGVMPEKKHGEGHCGERHGHRRKAEDIDDRLISDFIDIGHMMRRQYEGRASQKRILMLLNESEKLTQRELTQMLGIQPGSASEILAKLENAGLIVRAQNEADRRTIDISLTDAGVQLAEEAAQQRRKRHEEMFVCLSSEEKDALHAVLEKIINDWEKRFPRNAGRECRGRHEGHGGRGMGARRGQ